MTVLITGGARLIGAGSASRLLARGDCVTVVGNFSCSGSRATVEDRARPIPEAA